MTTTRQFIENKGGILISIENKNGQKYAIFDCENNQIQV
jgi:hypothetical protein